MTYKVTIILPELESKHSTARDNQTGVLEDEGVVSKCFEALREPASLYLAFQHYNTQLLSILFIRNWKVGQYSFNF